jgi:hypothetical protein
VSWIVDFAVAVVPIVLGWMARVLRRVDKRTERVEEHDRVLFGEDRVDGVDGIVPKVQRHDRILTDVALTDGGDADAVDESGS